ncbi:MAG: dihydrolipoyllysine-residue acetyltransferase [Coxiellaceae bacterium]|nr:dihydrolipoyllysine-residue acetyltransferase [Coxiellaceae bacterium]
MAEEKIKIPDLGGAADVDVIEVLVKPGDVVDAETPIATLEGDKATMDVPSPKAGKVVSVDLKVGDKVSEGDPLVTLEAEGAAEAPAEVAADKPEEKVEKQAAEPVAQITEQEIKVPDLGGADQVDVIEINVAVGDNVEVEQALITLEGDKATMDVPSPIAGEIKSINIKVGDKVSEGDVIAIAAAQSSPADSTAATKTAETIQAQAPTPEKQTSPVNSSGEIYAGPAVRRLAHELEVDLSKVKGTGNKGRITKDDLKRSMGQGGSGGGDFPFKLAPLPKVDFNKFGETETLALGKIKKATAANMARNWVGIPHVTQFDQADITDMEAFRQEQKGAAAAQGVKLTPIVFIMKAVVAALREFPHFNASLDNSGENLVLKKYFHIGIAVDTPNGLVVPVIRDVEKKSIIELAKELGEISVKARDGKLGLGDMQGGCFTISSLGGIGGTAFTPIINAPEVSILGVSRSAMQPVFNKKTGEFIPRLMLPLSLSYDHRVIDGAAAARFTVFLASRLADIQTLLL